MSPLSTYNLFICLIHICSIYTTSEIYSFISKWHLLLQHFSCGNTTQGNPSLLHRFLFSVVSYHPPVPRFNIPHSLLPNHNVLCITIPLVISEMEKVNFLLSMYHPFWTCVPTTSPSSFYYVNYIIHHTTDIIQKCFWFITPNFHSWDQKLTAAVLLNISESSLVISQHLLSYVRIHSRSASYILHLV